jgi:hypothetical protein
MHKIVDLINSLPDMLPLKPAAEEQIMDAERQLSVSFADEYKAYLAAFGSIMADGIELTGIAKSEHRNVVSVTKRERELNPNVPDTMYVIENTCVDGIMIWQDTTGAVYQSTPNAAPKRIASSLEEYLLNRISK